MKKISQSATDAKFTIAYLIFLAVSCLVAALDPVAIKIIWGVLLFSGANFLFQHHWPINAAVTRIEQIVESEPISTIVLSMANPRLGFGHLIVSGVYIMGSAILGLQVQWDWVVTMVIIGTIQVIGCVIWFVKITWYL